MVDFAGVLTDPDAGRLYDYLLTARERGVRTALLSNAPGASAEIKKTMFDYFDALVFSGEVGVAKPDPEVYRIAADRLGLPATRCAFVDDSGANVRGAVEAGMVGVHHRSVEETLTELGVLFPDS
ncbi:HAD-IA family hydrolase [Amycolatopsis sp. OK19-0408]|uniref:HAD-IA family hydrolase n=1 Tax=Amycolatopsis iheyensis TaxID=2945988 RepID=A0A9X2N5D1_9PSEU|nr:HAD-IA family hydrolase [Amycolatopsis iheyensis]MCR6481602.1 HAD-IA family hydrolase [Amycolatopsis iheyensis]